MFKKAERSRKKLRFAINGPSGAGKTYSMLAIASELGQKIAVIDTEHGSSTLYAEYFDFDQCDLDQYHPNKYIEAIRYAGNAGYEVIVIDSLSHAWIEMLNMVGGNFNNWAKVRPLERSLIDCILASPAHVLVSMRSKSDYVDDIKNGKATKVKVGTKAVMADGIEYEFDLAGEIDLGHVLMISKSRCKPLQDTTWSNPGKELADQLKQWLSEGAESIEVRPEQVKKAAPAPVSQPEKTNPRNQIAATFKEHYTSLGVSRDKAIEIMHSIDANANHPADLEADELKECLDLITQESKKLQQVADEIVGLTKAEKTVIGERFKSHYESCGMSKEDAILVLAEFGVKKPWDLGEDDFIKCLETITERSKPPFDVIDLEKVKEGRAKAVPPTEEQQGVLLANLSEDEDTEGSVNWMHK